MDRLLYSVTVLSFIVFALVLVSVRRAHIRVEYSVSWLAAAVALLVLSRSRVWLETVSRYMGITYPPMALVMIVGFVFLLMFFRFSVIISKLRDDNIALAQRLAIVEYQMKQAQPAARD